MTTKQQRTAMNLTKLAKFQGIERGTEAMFTELYEIGKDAGIAAIDGTKYGISHLVFVPQKEWDEVHERVERDKRYGITNAEVLYKIKVEHWRDMANAHQF